jgi:ABC-type transport system involved in cytochrome bd biosynthesis fused ATPase/permease subunit
LIGVRNRAIRFLSRLLLVIAVPLTILALAWTLFGPPTLTSLLGTVLIVFLFISALGISNNHQDRRPPGR